MRDFGKVGVLMGGRSPEREISLMSGKEVLEALLASGVDAHPLDVGSECYEQIRSGKFDRLFNILHGGEGEDGTIQGLLEFLNIPYTGSGVLASALAMDKIRSKDIFRARHLPTPKAVMIDLNQALLPQIEKLKFPLAVKPVNGGSTIGLSKVLVPEAFSAAVELAKQYGAVMAEEWVEGQEFTVGVVGDRVLPSIRIEARGGCYDFQQKYFVKTSSYYCPSGLNPQEEAHLAKMCQEAFEALEARHWGRFDLMRDSQGDFYFLEFNTIPGMTPNSLVPKAAKAIGWSFPETVLKVLEQTL